jgi:hypothetical protein
LIRRDKRNWKKYPERARNHRGNADRLTSYAPINSKLASASRTGIMSTTSTDMHGVIAPGQSRA